MVHIQQGALRTFEQEIITRLVRVVEFPRNVCHHVLEKFCVVHGLGVDRIELHLAIADVRSEGVTKNELARPQKSCQHMVVQGEEFAQLRCKPFGILEILNPQRTTGNLVLISWTNPPAGGANLFRAALLTGGLPSNVKRCMEWKDQRAGLADAQA